MRESIKETIDVNYEQVFVVAFKFKDIRKRFSTTELEMRPNRMLLDIVGTNQQEVTQAYETIRNILVRWAIKFIPVRIQLDQLTINKQFTELKNNESFDLLSKPRF